MDRRTLQAAEAVVATLQSMERDGLVVGTAGNVSVRVGDRLVISPSGVAPGDLDPALVSVLDPDDRLVSGWAPSSELALHRMAHDATGLDAIVHTHSRVATALSTTHTELPAIHYAIVALGGPVRVAPYATFGTAELAANVTAALADRRAALLANHGTVTCGPTLARAFEDAVLLEWLCDLYWHALQVGTPRVLTAAELEDVRDRAEAIGYGSLKT